MRILAIIISVLLIANTANAKELKFGVFFSDKASIARSVLKPWAKWFEEQADGEATIKFFFGGSLGKNPRQQYKLVTGGVMDITFMAPSYTPGTFPDMDLFQAPNMARTAAEGSTAAWKMYEMGLLRNLDKVKPVGIVTTGAYSIHTTKPVRSLADLKGLKLRAAGKIQSEVVKALGATPVGMPPTRIAENITRGLLQGSVSEWNAARTFKILEVTNNHYRTSLGVLPLMIAMNNGTYDALGPKAKKAIDNSGRLMAKLHGQASQKATEAMIAKIAKDSGKTLVAASAEDVAKMEALFKPIIDDLKNRVGVERWTTYNKILESMR